MTDPLAAYASRAVPRYTSYPTAPHFRKGFAEATYRGWLGALDPAEPVSLYLHVPFCKQMCWYCGCNMKLAAKYAPVADYVERLLQEIDLVADALPGRMAISHLHWGGGTPTALDPDDLARAMDRIHARFDTMADASLAIESDPRTLSDAMAARIGALGFTRASFGVQEFDPKVQAAINRIQPPEMVRHTVESLRAAGVSGINFDLIYGLPYQTVESLLHTIELCRDMAPDRIALFGYAHVPWMAKNQRMIPEDALPDGPARKAQARRRPMRWSRRATWRSDSTISRCPTTTWRSALREGRLRRNFQGYTTDTAPALIGIGATSIGRNPGGFVQNIAETGAWSRAVADGILPVAKGVPLSADDRLRGRVIEALMCEGMADTAAIGADHGFRRRTGAPRNLPSRRTSPATGWWTLDGPRVTLTETGRGLSRVVAAVFDAYLAQFGGPSLRRGLNRRGQHGRDDRGRLQRPVNRAFAGNLDQLVAHLRERPLPSTEITRSKRSMRPARPSPQSAQSSAWTLAWSTVTLTRPRSRPFFSAYIRSVMVVQAPERDREEVVGRRPGAAAADALRARRRSVHGDRSRRPAGRSSPRFRAPRRDWSARAPGPRCSAAAQAASTSAR